MVTKMAEEKVVQQEVVIPPPETMVPEALLEQAKIQTAQLTEMLKKQKEVYFKRLAAAKAGGAGIEASDPGLATYQYWNCLSYGPYQFGVGTNPPYLPNKVIAAGEWAMMRALIWINDQNGPGGSLPGTIVLGGREFTMRFETVNLTHVANGPDLVWTDTFTSPAPEYYWHEWWFMPGDPGPAPHLYELNLTADLTLGGQPFAAFSTWHADPDTEPPFYGLPMRGAHWQFERSARFLVYRK